MKIENVELKTMAVRTSQYPEDGKPEFLLVGRSNVGKSSFINTLVDRKNFARTSATPGKTQTLNFYLVNDYFYLVDVPGYGFASVNKDMQHKFGLMIEEYIKSRKNLKRVFLLVDYRHKPSEDDLLMFNFMKYYNLDVTIEERSRNQSVPATWYVIEQANMDGIVIWQSPKGEIYQTSPNSSYKKICNSLSDYLSATT